MDNPAVSQPGVIDPISRQILERTASQHRAPGLHHAASSSHSAGVQLEDPKLVARQTTGLIEQESLQRSDSLLSNRGPKEKKKGFLSRILGGKSRDDTHESSDHVSELMDNREPGTYAEVFSQPIGYVPKFPAPPRYIRVKAQNRTKRDFDRLFLAQILSEGAPRSRKTSNELDSKIHAIDDKPTVPPPNSTRTRKNAIWAAEFSKDGQYYAAGGQDKKLKVWRVISSKEDREAGGENEQDVKLNAPVFKQELIREYEGHTSAILDLSWSKNNFLLSSSMDKTVRLYHISRPECLCAFKHNDFVTSISFHPRDDRFFLAGSLDAKIRLWSIPDKNVAYWAQVQDMVTAVAFTPDGKTAIAGTLAGLCTLYDTEGLKAHSQIHVRSNRGKNSKGSKITGIETIQVPGTNGPPDVKILITSNDSRIRLYNLRDRSLEAKFRGHENTSSQIRASFSDDGKFVICGSEDKRVYIWPTGPVEKQDSDKRPVETFEAHTAIVTTALILPIKSRRLLARSGDPIYDLCNPPPVRLLSRTDSILSSQAPTQVSEYEDRGADTKTEVAHQSIEESPQYAARHSHYGGLVLVTGDYTGEIKVFRQDCAYQKRLENSWDTASFSKKMLGRSGSVATRTSERPSSLYRKSMIFGEPRSPAQRERENIINWRNSVMSAKNVSATNSMSEIAGAENSHRSSLQEDRERSSSPSSGFGVKRGIAHRFSLRHGSTPLTNSSHPSAEESRRLETPSAARVDGSHLNGASNTANPNYFSTIESHGLRRKPSHEALHSQSPSSRQMPTRVSGSASNQVPDMTFTSPSPVEQSSFPARNAITSNAPSRKDAPDNSTVNSIAVEAENVPNDLFLLGGQRYMAYDVRRFLPLVNKQPRTPGPSTIDRPGELGREESFVSTLSSEVLSAQNTRSASLAPNNEVQGLGINGAGAPISANASDRSEGEDEELRCRRCGNENFSMVKHGPGKGSGLKCRRCGEFVSS